MFGKTDEAKLQDLGRDLVKALAQNSDQMHAMGERLSTLAAIYDMEKPDPDGAIKLLECARLSFSNARLMQDSAVSLLAGMEARKRKPAGRRV